MLYTIAIPTHNNIETIKKCIKSAIELEFDDYEIIVSDTSENEDTWNLLIKMDIPNLRYYRNNHKWSMWKNHNFLLENANGKYVLFLHSDDVLLKDSLKVIDKHMSRLNYPDRIIMTGTSIYKNFKNHIYSLGFSCEEYICGSDALELFIGGGLTPCGTVFSKDILEIGGFIGDSMVIPYSDTWTDQNCALKGFRFYVINDIYFLRSQNSTKFVEGDKRQVSQVYNSLKKYFDDNLSIIIINMAIAKNSFYVLRHFICDERYKMYILKELLRILYRHPLKNRRFIKTFIRLWNFSVLGK